MQNEYVKVNKSALLSVLVLIGALQQTKTQDADVIQKLQRQLDDLKNEDNGLDDPEINSQLDRVAQNAAAQPHDTVVARNDQQLRETQEKTSDEPNQPPETQVGETGVGTLTGAPTGDQNKPENPNPQ